MFYHPDKVNEKGNVVFNIDLVKMTINVKNAENIFKKAIKTLEGPIPKADEECGYCGWVDECEEG